MSPVEAFALARRRRPPCRRHVPARARVGGWELAVLLRVASPPLTLDPSFSVRHTTAAPWRYTATQICGRSSHPTRELDSPSVYLDCIALRAVVERTARERGGGG